MQFRKCESWHSRKTKKKKRREEKTKRIKPTRETYPLWLNILCSTSGEEYLPRRDGREMGTNSRVDMRA